MGNLAIAQDNQFLDARYPLDSAFVKIGPIESLNVILEMESSDKLFQIINKKLKPKKIKEGILVTVSSAYVTVDKKSPTTFKDASSFLVDYKEPIFEPIKQEIIAKYGTQPTIQDLELFTNNYIPDKKNILRFAMASDIAKEKKGDCKSHAIFLAALARIFEYKSRIVLGTLVIRDPVKGNVMAYGHAWVETSLKNQDWKVADATGLVKLNADLGFNYYYIPMSTIDDESESYQLSIIRSSLFAVSKVKIPVQ